MADYITSTASSLHSSPSRKRTRESLTTRSSNHLSSCKTAVTATSNVEVMESSESETPVLSPSITQPRSSIHSVYNGLSSIKSKADTSNGSINPLNDTATPAEAPAPIVVSKFFHSVSIKNEITYCLPQ